MTPKAQPTHPAELPCEDPDCRQGRGTVICLRCASRMERARREHRLRLQRRQALPFDQPDHHDFDQGSRSP